MRGTIVGVVSGALVALAFLLLVGVAHRYAFGPPLSPFGHEAFFTDMSIWGVVVLVLIRALAAWIGAIIAVRVSDEPHATWTGPITVMVSTLTTLILMGMSQPIWSLLVTALLVFAIGWSVGRAHVGLPFVPDELTGRFGSGAEG